MRQLASLKAALDAWREETRDPMSEPELRNRYIEEVKGRKGRGNWTYEEYFDSRRSEAK